MLKKRITLLLAAVLVFLPSISALAQTPARWEGIVSRSNKQKMSLTVHARGFAKALIVRERSARRRRIRSRRSQYLLDALLRIPGALQLADKDDLPYMIRIVRADVRDF